jgi:bifunctional non-homologous end joining protein LigD
MATEDALEHYRQKRNFALTAEPSGGGKVEKADTKALAYVIQKHWASHLHYDFRLEWGGTLKSWAVPKGPSLDPTVKRMAVQVEDHPLSYGSFEGTIPAKQYGAGNVIVWDRGSWLPLQDAVKGFRDGKLKFEIRGEKLRGKWALVRMKGSGEKQPPWLLIKERDAEIRLAAEYDITEALPDSVISRPGKGQVATGIGEADLPAAAVRAKLPPMREPQLATLVESAPEGGDWHYELKFDGYRLMTRFDSDRVRCFTRNGHDWTDKMPQLAKSLQALGLKSCWLDGEIVVPDAHGIPNFQLLQSAFEGRGRRVAIGSSAASPNAAANTAAIVYYVFDIPFYAGHDLRDVPLLERRALLQQLLKKNTATNVRFSDSFDAPSEDLIASACKLGFEGLIGKRGDAPYQSGRSRDWVKLKCGKRQEFLICGFTEPQGSRNGLGALLLGIHDANGKLQYAGNVGSGFNEKTLADLRAQLDRLETETRPFDRQTKVAGKPHWVMPKLLAEISFAEWTNDNHVRHAVFRGLRSDKAPQAITREKVVKASELKTSKKAAAVAPPAPLPASLRITHGDRVVDAQSGVTKIELVQFYARVAPLMVPHLKARPVSLVRAPSGVAGELFFQKHAKKNELPGVNLLDPALDRDHEPLMEIHSANGLLSAAQMNTVEFHTWNAVASNIEQPDRMTFDLDPGDKVGWAQMQQAAMLVRTLLEELGLKCFLKTSGGKGMHVVVPLKKQHGWDTVKDFSHHIVDHLAKTLPQQFVSKSGPKNRVGKIFVDYLRNGFGATTACAWTARARPGMGVSVPVGWDELPGLNSNSHWTVQTIGGRLDVGNEPWAAYTKSSNSLNAAMKTLGYKVQPD